MEHDQGQGAGELLSDAQFGAVHFGGPGDGRGVVTPDCELEVAQVQEMIEDQIMKQDARHFKVVDGEVLGFDPGDDVWGPGQAPDKGVDVVCAGKPDAPDPMLAGVGVADERRRAGNELGTEGGPIAHHLEHETEVGNGFGGGCVGVEVDGVLVQRFRGMEEAVKWREQCLATRNAQASVLAFAKEGFECLAVHVAGSEEVVACGAQSCDFAGGQLDGLVCPIKEPSQNFFACVPDTFTLKNEFLVGNGVLAVVASGGRGGGKIWWMA